jgi:hypothetical protein
MRRWKIILIIFGLGELSVLALIITQQRLTKDPKNAESGFIVDLCLLTLRCIMFLLNIVVTVIFLRHVWLFKSLKEARMRAARSEATKRSIKGMIFVIFTFAILYLMNELIELVAYPTLYLIIPKSQADFLSKIFGMIIVAVIDFVLALGQLYLFHTMNKVIGRRNAA